MAGKALLAFLITATLTVVAFSMHHKHPEQISFAQVLVLAAVALLSLAVAIFGKSGVNAGQQERDHVAVEKGVHRVQQERDRTGRGHLCNACGHSETPKNPLVLTKTGFRIHRSHFSDLLHSGFSRG